MAEDVRQAQASWSRLGPVPGDAGRELTERFHQACNRFHDQYRRKCPRKALRAAAGPVSASLRRSTPKFQRPATDGDAAALQSVALAWELEVRS